MNDFLNEFSDSMNRSGEDEIEKLMEIFRSTIALVHSAIGEKAFRPHKVLNAAVFDSVMVGIADRLSSGTKPDNASVVTAYGDLIQRQEYLRLCERSTADKENVESRLRLARTAFART